MAIRSRFNQLRMAGAEPDVAGLLRYKAAAPIKPRAPQARCDIGLFSDEADQMDLLQPKRYVPANPKRAAEYRKEHADWIE